MGKFNDVVGKMVTLKAAPHASQRTKNRIREHGPVFCVKNSMPAAQWFDGPAILVEPMASRPTPLDNPERWAGWLPFDEIVIL